MLVQRPRCDTRDMHWNHILDMFPPCKTQLGLPLARSLGFLLCVHCDTTRLSAYVAVCNGRSAQYISMRHLWTYATFWKLQLFWVQFKA